MVSIHTKASLLSGFKHPPSAVSANDSAEPVAETDRWLTEHERALHILRTRITELEHEVSRSRDLVVPQTIAVAALFALPLIFCLSWLAPVDDSHPATGWMLLLGPT